MHFNDGMTLPDVSFQYRVRTDGYPITYVNTENGDANPFEWETRTADMMFGDKRVVVFSLPGAFTPTCSTYQVPGFEAMYDEICTTGDIDEIYVISVNDTFVMRQWMINQNIQNLKFIPDGNGSFTEEMGMLVEKYNLGFGKRSWRYAMVVNNGVVEKFFEEPGRCENAGDDPYGETSPENILEYLKSTKQEG
jgi:peroxiredoxin